MCQHFYDIGKIIYVQLKNSKKFDGLQVLWFKWNLFSGISIHMIGCNTIPWDCNFFYQFQKLIWINEQKYCYILLTVMPDQGICCKNHIFWIEKKIQIIMACAMSCSAAAFHFTKVPFTYHIYRKKYKKIPTCSFYHCPTKYSK